MKRPKTTRGFYQVLFFTTVLIFCFNFSFAQPELPPRTITVTATQGIHFGTFCLTGGVGGTVTEAWDGTRTSSGSIALLGMAPTSHPAIFEIKLCHGRNVIITYDATTILNGSNGGSFTLNMGPTEKGPNGASFIIYGDCNYITLLRMGGTLLIPGTALPGTYSGSFAITFNQQ
jgi:hypothetical protein